MSGESQGRGSTLMPSLRYQDAQAAIRWLEQALGFVRHAVYAHDDGTVQHAELRHGSGMVMLGSASNPGLHPHLQAHPGEIGGRSTSTFYLVVADCEPIWRTAKEAGAEVLMDMRTMDYGGRAFTVRDPEGYQWAVGEYDPWTAREADTHDDRASKGA